MERQSEIKKRQIELGVKMEDKEKNEIITARGVIPLNELEVTKGNILINAGKSFNSLKTIKILNLCIAKLDPFKKLNPSEGLKVRLSMDEIKAVLNYSSTKIYNIMKNEVVINLINNNTFYFNNDSDETTGFQVLVQDATYKNGMLEVNFGEKASLYLQDVQNLATGYTTYKLANTSLLDSPYACNLYEVLRAQVFKLKKEEKLKIHYGVNELKFMIGVYDLQRSESIEAKRSYERGNRDYDELTELLQEGYKKVGKSIPYKQYADFRKRVLIPAQKEMNNKTDIYFDYEEQKYGRKIVGVTFTVKKNDTHNIDYEKLSRLNEMINSNPQREEFKDEMVDHIAELFGVSYTDSRTIAKEAQYQLPVINNVYLLMKKSNKKIENITGWAIKCIRENWGNVSENSNDSCEEDNYEEVSFDEVSPLRK